MGVVEEIAGRWGEEVLARAAATQSFSERLLTRHAVNRSRRCIPGRFA